MSAYKFDLLAVTINNFFEQTRGRNLGFISIRNELTEKPEYFGQLPPNYFQNLKKSVI